MIYIKGTTTLDGKTYEATKVDYNGYATEDGQIDLNSKTYYAHKRYGIEETPSIYTLYFINQLESIYLELETEEEALIDYEKLILPTDGTSISGTKLVIL